MTLKSGCWNSPTLRFCFWGQNGPDELNLLLCLNYECFRLDSGPARQIVYGLPQTKVLVAITTVDCGSQPWSARAPWRPTYKCIECWLIEDVNELPITQFSGGLYPKKKKKTQVWTLLSVGWGLVGSISKCTIYYTYIHIDATFQSCIFLFFL